MKKLLCIVFCAFLTVNQSAVFANNGGIPEISAPSAILMDYATGNVIYEKNPDEKLPLASVTKIMTMLIAMEEISNGNMKYDDTITASAHAKSYGGSTIFLDEGEEMSVRDILKGVAVASGNDAAVALGEHIAGTEALFVERMNKRAAELGMTNTHFVNCNGLDADGHYSTARDIAAMSRELMKHPDIFNFTSIWMDSLRNGEFTLSNTNKLVRFYPGCTGLKTGSTSKAKFCISATAMRDNMHLVAVIMAADTSKKRQSDASSLLNYGFSAYSVENVISKNDKLAELEVPKSSSGKIFAVANEDYYSFYKKDSKPQIEIKTELKNIKAPAKRGDEAGIVRIIENGRDVCQIKLILDSDAQKKGYALTLGEVMKMWLYCKNM